ncbi:hypothetical protein MKW98_009365 [Papaver atlanticum]|uniref:Uncharacterized protein n=1 Tax=Papaver atlanticum TaxID=357466 RepID=A0AAD4S073_9MAGN|nr:hypothetical protein MKW98_009365 [Papaver atlanticum]
MEISSIIFFISISRRESCRKGGDSNDDKTGWNFRKKAELPNLTWVLLNHPWLRMMKHWLRRSRNNRLVCTENESACNIKRFFFPVTTRGDIKRWRCVQGGRFT